MGGEPHRGTLLPIRDRPLSSDEIERMRLALSTFRDGSGQYLKRLRKFMPSYLDFERVTALVCNGITSEDKGIFDVVVPVSAGLPFGVSCKMSSSQPVLHRAGFMELSNSHAMFQAEFDRHSIDWRTEPEYAGPAVVELVAAWHEEVSDEFDLAGSRYLVLSHDSMWQVFQLHCYPLDLALADPYVDVEWCVEGRQGPSSVAGYIAHEGRRHRLWQLFQNSGGQLKYYPPLDWADWASDPFSLEAPPIKGIIEKVEEYFPGRWP